LHYITHLIYFLSYNAQFHIRQLISMGAFFVNHAFSAKIDIFLQISTKLHTSLVTIWPYIAERTICKQSNWKLDSSHSFALFDGGKFAWRHFTVLEHFVFTTKLSDFPTNSYQFWQWCKATTSLSSLMVNTCYFKNLWPYFCTIFQKMVDFFNSPPLVEKKFFEFFLIIPS